MTARIAITGAGGAAAIGLFRALAVEDDALFMLDSDPAAAGLYLVPAGRRAIVPPGRAERFGELILDWCVRHRIDVLVPTVEAEFMPIAGLREQFADAGVALVLESDATIAACTDKWALTSAVGPDVPQARTEVIDERFDCDSWDYPLMTKPRCASGSRGIAMMGSPAELASIARDGTMLAQGMLPGGEYSVDVLCDGPGRVIAAVPRERIKVDSGIAVAARTVHDEELIRVASAAARDVGITNIANVQLRRDEHGLARLLEINARLPGTMALTIAAGINMPLHVVRRTLGRNTDPVTGEFGQVAMVRMLDDLVIAPSELAALEAGFHPLGVPA